MSTMSGKCLASRSLTTKPSSVGWKLPLSLGHVLPLLDGGEDGGIGAGTPDAPLLQHLNQGGFGEAGRGLGEVLLGEKLYQLELVAFFQWGQGGAGLFPRLRLCPRYREL